MFQVIVSTIQKKPEIIVKYGTKTVPTFQQF